MIRKLLTRAEAASLIGVKPQTLAVWACKKRHGLEFIKVGRIPMYSPDTIESWLKTRTQKA